MLRGQEQGSWSQGEGGREGGRGGETQLIYTQEKNFI